MSKAEQPNALISVFDKTDLEEFAEGLHELNWNIYSSSGTAKRINEAGIPVTDVSELVGGGPIFGHRVVTLSREIYAGILAEDTPEDNAELENLEIPKIDLVCVDMYPLGDEISQPNATEQSVIEKTDIGGPTLLRAAAKSRRIVLSNSEQRPEVIDWLKSGRPDDEGFRRGLAAAAERAVAEYVNVSASYIETGLKG